MPERPDLEYVAPVLNRALVGHTITDVVVRKPVVLRLGVASGPAVLVGRRFVHVARHAHFVVFTLDGDFDLVVSPMLAGRFAVVPGDARAPGDLALALTCGDGRVLRYRDDVAMGKVYVMPRASLNTIPGFAPIGVDVLDASRFTREAFRALAKKRRDQVKVFLMDKTALDAMGNAYADEVCWAAGLHPKRRVASLTPTEVDALHDAIVAVLREARDVIRQRQPPLDEKVRDFLKVRGRAGEPCPRCATTLRSAGVHGHDAEFCPTCQVDVGETSIVDWRRVPVEAGAEVARERVAGGTRRRR